MKMFIVSLKGLIYSLLSRGIGMPKKIITLYEKSLALYHQLEVVSQVWIKSLSFGTSRNATTWFKTWLERNDWMRKSTTPSKLEKRPSVDDTVLRLSRSRATGKHVLIIIFLKTNFAQCIFVFSNWGLYFLRWNSFYFSFFTIQTTKLYNWNISLKNICVSFLFLLFIFFL